MLVGLQGNGKTTTAAKMAKYFSPDVIPERLSEELENITGGRQYQT